MQRKLTVIIALAIGLVVYLTLGIPWFTGLVETNGILVAFPIFLSIYAIFAYIVGAMAAGRGAQVFVIFICAFLLGDILLPPLLVARNGQIPELPSQQLASDVFFFEAFTAMGFGVVAAYWMTYLLVPLLCAIILVLELKSKAFSRYLPNIIF